jgi:DNA-binding CsgD family transcriptional regulator
MEFGSQFLDTVRERYRLTPTQARVALMLAVRFTNEEIARELSCMPNTARRHTEAVMLRLDVRSRFKVQPRLAEFLRDGTHS